MSSVATGITVDNTAAEDQTDSIDSTAEQWPVTTSRAPYKTAAPSLNDSQTSPGFLDGSRASPGRYRTSTTYPKPGTTSIQKTAVPPRPSILIQSVQAHSEDRRNNQMMLSPASHHSCTSTLGLTRVNGHPTPMPTMPSETQTLPVPTTRIHRRSLPDMRTTSSATRPSSGSSQLKGHFSNGSHGGLERTRGFPKQKMDSRTWSQMIRDGTICATSLKSPSPHTRPRHRTSSIPFMTRTRVGYDKSEMKAPNPRRRSDAGSIPVTGKASLDAAHKSLKRTSRPVLTRLASLSQTSKPYLPSQRPLFLTTLEHQRAQSSHFPAEHFQRAAQQNTARSTNVEMATNSDCIVQRLIVQHSQDLDTMYTRAAVLAPHNQGTDMHEASGIDLSILAQSAHSPRLPPCPVAAPPKAGAVMDTASYLGSLFADSPLMDLNEVSLGQDSSTKNKHSIYQISSNTRRRLGEFRSYSPGPMVTTARRTDQEIGTRRLTKQGDITNVIRKPSLRDTAGKPSSTLNPRSLAGLAHHTQSAETESCKSSPGSLTDDSGYNTPLTSPATSPLKPLQGSPCQRLCKLDFVQLDGPGSTSVEILESRQRPINADVHLEASNDIRKTLRLPLLVAGPVSQTCPTTEGHLVLTDFLGSPEVQPALERDTTLLLLDNEAKCHSTSSAPTVDPYVTSTALESSLSRGRRQASGILRRTPAYQVPDRFVPRRTGTPTKDGLNFQAPSMPSKSITSSNKRRVQYGRDPFGPLIHTGTQPTERSIPSRSPGLPAVATRPASATATRTDRSLSILGPTGDESIWSVGGLLVTEGIASTSDGRGGRVTSGTNATHHMADFVRRSTPAQSVAQHSERLALAMEIDVGARMIEHMDISSRLSSQTTQTRAWRNSRWETMSLSMMGKQPTRPARDIPTIPFRVLDAPALRDDFYCSLLAYSSTLSCLAVGLGAHVYLWSETKDTSNTAIPDSLTSAHSSHVTSLAFSSTDGAKAILAIGRADGRITLWSPLDREPRFDSEQPSAVSCLAFRPLQARRTSMRDSSTMVMTEELLVGDERGHIYYYSIEWPDKDQRDLFDWHGSMNLLSRIDCHAQQVCGVCWNPTGDFFASGGNDNQLFLFEVKKLFASASSGPQTRIPVSVRSRGSKGVSTQDEIVTSNGGQARRTFSLNAAVKAIAFAPWQPSLLAAGGGSNDRCIHFFHTQSGANLATIDCHAQVTSLVWSDRKKEIAATFGFAQPEHPYRIAVFSWPSCAMVVAIPWWGEERALFAIAYPRGPAGHSTAGIKGKTDAEGRAWYGRRTREEGSLVVATSDASIKFHEIWADPQGRGAKSTAAGSNRVLRGSQILEGECSEELERTAVIR